MAVPIRRGSLAVTLLLLLATGCGGHAQSTGNQPSFLISTQNRLSQRSSGSERVLVQIDKGAYLRDPVLAPDGKQIAFVEDLPALPGASRLDFGSDLYVAHRDGSGVRLVAKHSVAGESIQTPVWLPDGQTLLFAVLGYNSDGADIRIESVDLASGTRQRLVSSAFAPALAPDGTTLAYVSSNGTFEAPHLLDLKTGVDTPLTKYDRGLVFFYSLAWSPDGTRIAFAAANPSTTTTARHPAVGRLAAPLLTHPFLQDVWLMDRDGGNAHRLTELAEWQPSVAWTPDGRALYVLAGSGLYRVDAASGARAQIGAGANQGQVVLLPGR